MGFSFFNNAEIKAILTVVPRNEIDINDELPYFNNDPGLLERNKKLLGLGTRHVADERTTNTDLCLSAAERLIEKTGIDREGIDCLIVTSSSHDYHYPASANVIQGALGLSEDCSCFDVSGLSCTAYGHGLWLAHSLVSSGASRRCLLLSGDIVSRHSHRANRNSNMLFGDAGSATIVEFSETPCPAWFLTGARGKSWDKIVAPAGGYNLPVEADIASLEITDAAGNIWRLTDDIMKGLEIFKFSTSVGPAGVEKLLAKAGVAKDDIDYFAFHQANAQIVNTVARYLHVPKEKFSTATFSRYGNAGAGAVVLEICEQLSQRQVENVMLATFGVGLSWAFAIVNLGHTSIFPVEMYDTPTGKPTREEKIRYWIDYFKGDGHAEK